MTEKNMIPVDDAVTFSSEYDLWNREGVRLKGLRSLAVWSTESDLIAVYDSAFAEPVMYREAGVKYHVNKGRCYVYLDEEAPGITDSISQHLKADRIVQAAEKEAVHVREMVTDLKTSQGRKRFLDTILRELADRDISAIPRHLSAHVMARVFAEQRKKEKKDRTMYIGLPAQWSAAELHSVRGDILVLHPDPKEKGHGKRLLTKTLSGDITVTNLQIDRGEMITTSGNLTVQDTEIRDLRVRALSGAFLWKDSTGRRLDCQALRGGARITKGTLRELRCEAKADRVELDQMKIRNLHMTMAAAETVLKGVEVKECRIESTMGDICAQIVSDVDADISTSAADIRLELENGYRGFTAKIEDGREEKKILKTHLKYGRMIKDYEGDCKIACNEKKSKLHILSKGTLVELKGSAKR